MLRASADLFFHLLILMLSLTVTVVVRTASKERYAQERRQIEAAARSERTLEITRKWNAVRYVDISTAAVSEKVLSNFDSPKTALTERQRGRLPIRLKDVLSYLRGPTSDGYLSLKTKGLHYSFTPSADALQLLLNKIPPVESDAESVARVLWNELGKTHGEARPGLGAICLERIRAAIVHTNSPGFVFNGPVAQGFTMARAAPRSGFRYGTGSNDTENVASDGPFLIVSFFARSTSSTNAGPVYLSLFWSEADQDWAPNRLFTDVVLNFNTFF